MIQQKTLLKVTDNSGAKIVKCIKVFNGFKKKIFLGKIIVVSIKTIRTKFKEISKVKKKQICKAIVLRTKIFQRAFNGFEICFFENAVVLINKQGNPIGNRITGVLSKKLKKKKYKKITNISSGFV